MKNKTREKVFEEYLVYSIKHCEIKNKCPQNICYECKNALLEAEIMTHMDYDEWEKNTIELPEWYG